MDAIKFLYFDYNGVLAQSRVSRKTYLANLLNVNEEELDTIKINDELKQGFAKIKDEESELAYLKKYLDTICTYFTKDKKSIEQEFLNLFFYQTKFELFPWTIQTLDYLLAKGYRMGIITNGMPSRRRTEIKYFGLDKYFSDEFITISKEVGSSKPHKEIYDIAKEKAKCAFSEIMILDDREDYIKFARELGFLQSLLVDEKKEFIKHEILPNISYLSHIL